MAGVDKFADVLASAHTTFRTALAAADLPLASLFLHLGTQYLPINGFFDLKPQSHFSYIDYRKLPGAAQAERCRQTTVLRVTTTSDARTWYFRTHEGIYMFNNFIDTPRAREVLAAYETSVRRVLTNLLDLDPVTHRAPGSELQHDSPERPSAHPTATLRAA